MSDYNYDAPSPDYPTEEYNYDAPAEGAQDYGYGDSADQGGECAEQETRQL